jgi:hypothetical protein
MTGLMLPSGLAPSNLHLRESVKATYVESDVYDIARRLAAVSPNLNLWQLDEHVERAWVVTETVHGVEHKVKNYAELDARMIDDVQRMLSIPLTHRLAVAQAEIDKAEAQQKQDAIDEMYEKVGQKFWHQLEKDGFVQRGTSYHKSYIKQRKGR